jgi:hypothetical protein
MLVWGPGGVGKTSTSCHAPKPKVLRDRLERGFDVLQNRGLVPEDSECDVFASWDELIDQVETFAAGDHDRQTLIIDAMTGVQRVLFLDMIEKEYDRNDADFYSYSKGPKNAANRQFPILLERLTDCVVAGYNVIVIAHSKEKTKKPVKGSEYDKFIPDVEPDVWAKLYRWADTSILINDEVSVMTDRKGRSTKQADESGSFKVAYCSFTPLADVKNWYGVPGPIDMGDSAGEAWKNIAEAFGW